MKKLGCEFSDDVPINNNEDVYIPSVNFVSNREKSFPMGLHSILGCGGEGACKSCYIYLPIFIKPELNGKGLYIKPCPPLNTRFDITRALRNRDDKQVLELIKLSREYLMLMPGLGIKNWIKQDETNYD